MQSQPKVLLIGNGPAALARKVGNEIDNFDGEVVRFNNYSTDGFEEYVGSRTDIWITVEQYLPKKFEHKKRFIFYWGKDEDHEPVRAAIGATRIDPSYAIKTRKIMKFNHPSTGAIATTFFLDGGYDIYLWGFDFLEDLQGRQHHYNKDGIKRGPWHNSDAEWYFFNRCVNLGLVEWFGIPDGESLPRVRENIECGRNNNIADYREAAHSGWYSWFAESCKGKKVLDVGSGLCVGMKTLRELGASEVWGCDVDENLKGKDDNLIITDDLSVFDDKSFDVVTCVEVIEHVREDLTLMNHLKRIAREKILMTTPSYMRARCWNHAHCREYTIPQFFNIFKPDEVWSAAPSGTVHRTFLLEKSNGIIIDHSPEGLMNKRKMKTLPYYKDKIPWNLPFDQTVDGEEWPCICGIFNIS